MTDHKSLAEALCAFQAEMPQVAKDKKAQVPTKAGGQYSYTYADLAGVSAAAMPVLTRHGLSFTTAPRSTERGYELVGTLLHVSGECRDGALPIQGSGPQDFGSHITYMRRYLLGCLTGIVTEDDDDGSRAQKASRSKPQPTAQTEPDEPPAQTRTMSRPATAGITPAQMKAMQTGFGKAGITEREQKLDYCRNLIGRTDLTSSTELTVSEASRIIDALKSDGDQ